MPKAKRGKLLQNLTWENLRQASRAIGRPDGPPNRVSVTTAKRSRRHANATEPMAQRRKPRAPRLPKPETLAQLLKRQARERKER